jgi:hypothetical protein
MRLLLRLGPLRIACLSLVLLLVALVTWVCVAVQNIDKGATLGDLRGAMSQDIPFGSREAAVLQFLDDRGYTHGTPNPAADYPELQQDLVFQGEIQPLPDERVARAIGATIPPRAYKDAFDDLAITTNVRAYFLLDGDGLLVDIVFAAGLPPTPPP